MPVAMTSANGNVPLLSVSTSASFSVINDPSIRTTDSVSLSFELFVRLFPDSQKSAADHSVRFVLIKPIGAPDYFKRFKIFKVASVDDSATLNSKVTITNPTQLGIIAKNITVSGCVVQSIDSSLIPSLSTVYIEVPPAMFAVLHLASKSLVKDHLINKYLAFNDGVVANGDFISAINGHVRFTEPVYQGFVRTLTQVVFVKSDHKILEPVSSSKEENEIDLSQFISRHLLFEDGNSSSHNYFMNIAPLPHPIYVDSTAQEDPDLQVFVSTHDLSLFGFPIFNGELAILNLGDQIIVVKVLTFLEPNTSIAPKTIYMLPSLLINLRADEKSTAFFTPHKSASLTLSHVLPAAKTATVARIVSPITMDKAYQKSFLAGLKTTFSSRTKFFRKGDVFPVCIDSTLARTMFEVSQTVDSEDQQDEVIPEGIPDSVAWFKVSEIEGEAVGLSASQQYRIDPSQTALSSSGVEFELLPPDHFAHWNDYLGLPPMFDYLDAYKQSPALFKYAQDLAKVIETAKNTREKLGLTTTILVHSMSPGLGKATVVRSLAQNSGYNVIEIDAFDVIRPGAELKTVGILTGKIEKQLNSQHESASVTSFHIVLIKHIEYLCKQVDSQDQNSSSATSLSLKVVQALQDFMKDYDNIVVVATSNDIDKVSSVFSQLVKFQINVGVPTETERKSIFNFLLKHQTSVVNNEIMPRLHQDRIEFTEDRLNFSLIKFDMRDDTNFQTLALQSAGLTPRDLISIVRKSKHLAIKRYIKLAKEQATSVEKIIKIGNGGVLLFTPADFEAAINEARNEFSDSIGAPRIPNVKWEDIGGLELVKDEILDTIDMPLKHPELFANGLKKRSGILFYGPPGTGKTLLAKAIATNFSLNFFSVKGPELLNMYIGESEANVRRVFQRARDAKPCVIFFDELDSVAPKRGNQGDSGGVMDRIVSQLLAELDGMSGGESNGEGVFVVGATNRPDLLDEALLRPGRFDKMLYLGISDDDDKQTKILEALTRKFQLSDEVDLSKIAAKCPFTLTGADFYALCSDSMLNAMTRVAGDVDEKLRQFNQDRVHSGQEEVSSRWWFDNVATKKDIEVWVTMADFEKAQEALVPSVSQEELDHYLRVKQNFEGGKPENKAEPESNGFHDGQSITLSS